MWKVSFKNIQRNKTRTLLSVVGIVIGVASIIALVSVVDGLFADVQNVVGQIQGVRVVETRGDPALSSLDESLGEEFESFSGVSVAVPLIVGMIGNIDGKEIPFGTARVNGVDFSKQLETRKGGIPMGEIVEGRSIKSGETGVVVLGKQLKDDYDKFVGSSIEINGEKLKIVGVYSAGSALFDSSVMVSLSDARQMLGFPADKVSAFDLEPFNPQETQNVVDRLNFQSEGEYVALSSSDLAEQFSEILGSFRLLVVAVAAISSIVAGVGIVNTMLMSVIERFQEIGVLKAVGWTNESVMKMILLESLLIGLIGGLVGVVFGFVLSFVIQTFFGLNTLVTPLLVLEVFLYAVFLGVVGGAYPAFAASKMDPVSALTEE